MMKSRKVFYWIGSILGGTLLLLCGLLLAAPLLINLDSVHGKIETLFDRETGGQGTFQEIDLYFLPPAPCSHPRGKAFFSRQGSPGL